MTPTGETKRTLTRRFNEYRNRYRVQIAAAFAVVATFALVGAQFFPAVQEYAFQSGLVQYITLLVVLDLAVSRYLDRGQSTTQLGRNQDETMPRLIEAVSRCRSTGIYLLEYAGATTLPLIRAVRREGVPLQMLVKHPDTIVGAQRHRNIGALDTIINSIFDNYHGEFEVRCYRQPFSLRGRRLGNELLELGWLTPDVKRQMAYGHANPSVIVDLSMRSDNYLLEFFDRTFKDLWNDDDTEDARAVLGRLQSEI